MTKNIRLMKPTRSPKNEREGFRNSPKQAKPRLDYPLVDGTESQTKNATRLSNRDSTSKPRDLHPPSAKGRTDYPQEQQKHQNRMKGRIDYPEQPRSNPNKNRRIPDISGNNVTIENNNNNDPNVSLANHSQINLAVNSNASTIGELEQPIFEEVRVDVYVNHLGGYIWGQSRLIQFASNFRVSINSIFAVLQSCLLLALFILHTPGDQPNLTLSTG